MVVDLPGSRERSPMGTSVQEEPIQGTRCLQNHRKGERPWWRSG